MIGSEVTEIRKTLGAALGRRLSQRDLGLALGLSADNASRAVRDWESDRPTGPAAVALQLLMHCVNQGDMAIVREIVDVRSAS